MSKLIVEVCEIGGILVHDKSDNLEIAEIKGWTTIIKKGTFTKGDVVVYFPPDCILDKTLSERLVVSKYLKQVSDQSGRVAACRLRGYPSYGFVVSINDLPECNLPIGSDVSEILGVTKYEPPVKLSQGEQARENYLLQKYTSLEHVGNYATLFDEGEICIAEEKIEGTNSVVGYVIGDVPNEWVWAARSMGVQRHEFNLQGARSLYWMPLDEKMKAMILDIHSTLNPKQGINVAGEIYGAGIQKMNYNESVPTYRCFDICVDGEFLSYDERNYWLNKYDIKHPPLIYRGPFNLAEIRDLNNGPTLLTDHTKIKGFQGREGIVVRPEKESTVRGMRKILKSVSADYLANKGNDELQ